MENTVFKVDVKNTVVKTEYVDVEDTVVKTMSCRKELHGPCRLKLNVYNIPGRKSLIRYWALPDPVPNPLSPV